MIRIIHLSDFHLNKHNLSDWNSHIQPALFARLKEIEINPAYTFVVCTGDLIDKGGKDYANINDAFNDFKSQVIDVFCKELKISTDKFLIVPGNHDIDRNADAEPIELGYKSYFEKDYNNIMKFMKDAVEQDKREGIQRIVPFKNFETSIYKDIANVSKSVFGTSFKYEINSEKIGIACLNSSWRAYDEDDVNTLIVGEMQLLECTKFISDCSVKIALLHHPLDWLLPSERAFITNHIYKDFDILLIGHVHENKTSTQTGFSGSIFINVAPSCISDIRTDSKAFSNGVTIIDYDKNSREIDCKYYKYQHISKEFVLNTDLGESGRLCLKIPNPNSASTKQIIEKALNFIKQEQYPLMNEHIIAQKANVVKTISDAYIFPPIKDSNSEDNNEDRIITSLNEILKDKANYMFFGSQEIGKTTLLYRLIYEYTEEYIHFRTIPVYIDIDDIGNKDIITVIKSYLSCTTEEVKTILSEKIIVLLVDNFDYIPFNTDKINRLYKFLEEYQDVRVIASAKNDMDGILPSSYINSNKIPFKSFFMKPFTSKEIKGLMKVWVPNEEPLKLDGKLDKMVNNFCSYSLPCTAMSVSLFLWGTENSNRQPINQAVLLDICIELMLEKLAKENIYRSTFDYHNKCMLLAKIAQQMRTSDLPNCAISYSDYIKIIENYLKNDVGFDYDAEIIAKYFIERKLFVKAADNQIKFSHSCFFHFFLAKRMEFDIEYRKYTTSETNYHNYHKEIDFYSGLVRNDKNLLVEVYTRFKQDFEPLNFVFEQLDIDSFFTHVKKNSPEHETSAKNIDIKKIKENRPTEEQINAFYDKKLNGQQDKILKKEGGIITFEQLLVMMCNVLRNSEGVEDLQLKKDIYNSLIHGSVAWVVLYKEWLIHYIKENKQMPPSIPNGINLEYLLKHLPFNMQFGLQEHLGTHKLIPIILEKIKNDIHNSKCSDIEAYLSVALYADEYGKDYDKYFKKLIKRLSNNIVRDYCHKKLTYSLYLKTREGSTTEESYIDLLTELKIRSQKLPRRLTDQVKKSISDGKKKFIGKK